MFTHMSSDGPHSLNGLSISGFFFVFPDISRERDNNVIIKNTEEESRLRIDNSQANEQRSFAISGGEGSVTEETKLKNILQPEEDVSIASESSTYDESISEKQKIVSNRINCNFVEEERLSLEEERLSVEEERLSVEEERLSVEEERLNVDEERLNVVETTKNHLKVEQTKKLDKKLFLKNDSIKKLSVEGKNEETSMEPSKQWYNFSDEVQKKSSKLASFIRNAIPQNLTGTQLILTFKSGNYASMLTEENRKTLEKIVSDYIGYSIHVCCENIPRSVSQLTIVEHEQMLFEEKKEIKLKNARAFPQVKNILSVFTNSKITNIELLDVKDNLNYNN